MRALIWKSEETPQGRAWSSFVPKHDFASLNEASLYASEDGDAEFVEVVLPPGSPRQIVSLTDVNREDPPDARSEILMAIVATFAA